MTSVIHPLLRKCHDVMSANYDNSVHLPPDILREADGIGIEDEWAEYLGHKFRYLVLVEEVTGDGANSKIAEMLGTGATAYLEEFAAEWAERAEDEKLVYLYRLSQLPRRIVEKTWYAQRIQGCHQWCNLRDIELSRLDSEARRSSWDGRLASIYAEIGDRPSATCQQERMLSEIFRQIIGAFAQRTSSARDHLGRPPEESPGEKYRQVMGQVAKCFDCFEDTPLRKMVADDSLVESNLLAELSFELMTELHSTGFDETAVISRFLQSLKDHFKCEVCDFLDVSDDGAYIVWRAATVNHKELSPGYQRLSYPELRQQIRERESYGKGVGISGSVLVLTDDPDENTWCHIGSNDVPNDPRQSSKHRSAYEADMYPIVLKETGRIENFWIFPVFERGRLRGAFRVVNKTIGDGRLQRGGWPYFTRVQLALVAQWLSRFLETVSPQLQSPEDFIAILERNKRIDQMVARLELGWIERKPLQALLRHLERDISKKDEKRPVGCCIIIVRDDGDALPPEGLEDYPLLEWRSGSITDPYDGLDAYHDAVNPLMGAYVFDQKGAFIRIVKLRHQDPGTQSVVSGFESIEHITCRHRQAICLLLPSGARSILLYTGGHRVAEVLVSEKTADWRFRYPDDILKIMRSHAPAGVPPRVLQTVCDACLDLSFRGYGALIVIGDVRFDDLHIRDPKVPCQQLGCHLDSMDKDLLVEFAKMDGATFVATDGRVAKINRIVTPKRDLGEYKTIFPGRGGRHETGEKITRIAPDALVMIVSENRGISIVTKGGEFMEPDL